MTLAQKAVLVYCFVILVALVAGLVFLFINNYNLRRDNDALTRANAKMQVYINKRDKEMWDKPNTKRKTLIDTDTRVMTRREIADLNDPEPPATRLRPSRPRPRPGN